MIYLITMSNGTLVAVTKSNSDPKSIYEEYVGSNNGKFVVQIDEKDPLTKKLKNLLFPKKAYLALSFKVSNETETVDPEDVLGTETALFFSKEEAESWIQERQKEAERKSFTTVFNIQTLKFVKSHYE